MNKPWPNDNQIARFDDIVEPVRTAINQAYRLTRKRKPIVWTGLDIGQREKAGGPSPDEDLSVEGLAYHAERDRDPMDVIIAQAVRLGIEQGRRLQIEHNKRTIGYLADDLARLATRAKALE
jgi:hypothetical protein